MDWRQDKSGLILPSHLYEKPRVVRYYDRDRDRDRDGRTPRGGGGGGGGGGEELLRLNYVDEPNADPFSSISNWTIDRHFAALTRLTDLGWEARSSNGQGSMHADIAILDLNSQAVYVGVENVTVPATGVSVSMMVTKGHVPGAFWTTTSIHNINGYHCRLGGTQIKVYAGAGTGSQYAISPVFGDAIVDGTVSKLEMRVVMGASSNVIQIFLDDEQLGDDWEDDHADRIQGAEVFGTVGCAVSYDGSGAPGIVEEIYCGIL